MSRNGAAFILAIVLSIFFGSSAFAEKEPPRHSVHASSGHNKHRLHPALFPKRTQGKLLVTVSHNEYFPPLPESLRPGAVFNRDNLSDPSAKGESRWYQVPKWLSGEFSYDKMNYYYLKDFSKGTETNPHETSGPLGSGRHRGILLDKKGNIWQKAYGGGIVDPSHPEHDQIYKKFDDELSGYLLSPTQYVENSAGIEFYLDKNGKIRATQRWERIRNFQLKNGQVEVDVSEEKFDVDGKPLFLMKDRGTMTRREDFTPLKPGQTSSIAGTYDEAVRDLRKYMEAAGIPEDAPDAPPSVSTPETVSREHSEATGE